MVETRFVSRQYPLWLFQLEWIQKLRNYICLPNIIAMLCLVGCSTGLVEGTSHRELLQPWIEITGAQMSVSSGALSTDYVMLQRPAAISVDGNDLYLVDAGLRRIFRYERLQQTLMPFAVNLPVEAGMCIVSANHSVYITLPSYGKVMHFTRDGFEFPALVSPGNLVHPISIAVDERSGNVLVVDGLYNHIVVFNNEGMLLSVIRPPQVQSISAIATANGSIYAVDKLARQIVVLDWDGVVRNSFATDTISESVSIAVTHGNLLFIGDDFNNSVTAYSLHGVKGAVLTRESSRVSAVSDDFGSVNGLTIEGEMLFVADGLNARIQALIINPDAIE